MTSLDQLIADSWFPFAGDIAVKPLDERVIPEPPRSGLEPGDCHRAAKRYAPGDT